MLDYNADTSLSILTKSYPQITEKAIVDFLNTIPLVDDHLREKAKSIESPFSRVWSAITGVDSRRQSSIDAGFQDQIKFIQSYVLKNEERFSRSDILLSATMDGLALVSEKLRSISGGVESLVTTVNDLNERLCATEKRMDFHELHLKATAEKSAALAVFRVGGDGLSPEQALWLMFTRLMYGYFGQWLRLAKMPEYDFIQTRDDVLKTFYAESLDVFSIRSKRDNDELITRNKLFSSLSGANQPIKDSLCLLSTHKSSSLENIIFQLNGNEPDDLDDSGLPHIYSNKSIANEMILLLDQEVKYG